MSVQGVRPRRLSLAAFAVALPVAIAMALVATPAGAQTTSSPPQFASGIVTSVHGVDVQVDNQTQNSESTVVLSPSTTFQKRETAASSVIAAGDCVRAIGTGSAAKGITASTVSVSAATANGCTGGFGGAGGAGGRFGAGGAGRFGSGQRPPRSFPNGGGAGRNVPANFAIASGPVVSISGDKMTVKSTTFTRPKKKNAKPKRTTKNVTVSLAGTAVITQTVPATATDVAVGSCVTATGSTVAGGVGASTVTVSAPVNGACTGGFGFGRGAGGGGPTGSGGSV
jgi:hypothetical protein